MRFGDATGSCEVAINRHRVCRLRRQRDSVPDLQPGDVFASSWCAFSRESHDARLSHRRKIGECALPRIADNDQQSWSRQVEVGGETDGLVILRGVGGSTFSRLVLGCETSDPVSNRKLGAADWTAEIGVNDVSILDSMEDGNERTLLMITRTSEDVDQLDVHDRFSTANSTARATAAASSISNRLGNLAAPSDDTLVVCQLPWARRRNSSRVFGSSRKAPRSAEVIVLEFCFCTPRIIMQRWYASITTPTPFGSSTSHSASAICSVRRSCT